MGNQCTRAEEVGPVEVEDPTQPPSLSCRRDLADARDWILNIWQHSKVSKPLPAAVDLRPSQAFDLYNQGHLGSCTANALAAAFHFEQLRQGLEGFAPSRLFIYYNERAMEGTIDEDAGASLRDGIKALNQFGVCDEELWPYKISHFNVKPSPDCFEAAKKNVVKEYARVDQTLDSLKGCIVAGFPFVFGFVVCCDFLAGEARTTGKMAFPPSGIAHGGHAVQACGYDDARKAFIVRNSWGKEWGDNGHFYMPYDFITHSALCHSFWAIKLVDGLEFPKTTVGEANASKAAQGGA